MKNNLLVDEEGNPLFSLSLSLFLSSSPFHLNLFSSSTLSLSLSLATEIERAKKDPTYYLRVINPEAKAALEGLYQEYKAPVSLRL